MTITQPKLFRRCGGKDCPERLKCWRNQKPLEKLNVWYHHEHPANGRCEHFIGLPCGFTPVNGKFDDPDPLMRPSND